VYGHYHENLIFTRTNFSANNLDLLFVGVLDLLFVGVLIVQFIVVVVIVVVVVVIIIIIIIIILNFPTLLGIRWWSSG